MSYGNKAVKALIAICLTTMLMSNLNAQENKHEAFRRQFHTELANAGIIGGSYALMANGKTAEEGYYGSANVETGQLVDRDTIYHWASNTKPFTGIAIMQLRDRGLLKLDDPVTKYLPELRRIHNPFGSMDEITVRHLMTHSGGFRNGTWPWRNNKPWEPFEPTEWSQLVAMFPFTEVLFKPGSKFSYSNPGIVYLGRIIEEISGTSYEAYIEKNIFRPLEMHRSYFDTTPAHLLKHRSHSYFIRDGKRSEGRFDADTGITVSNSGLNSPVGDMLKYVGFLVGDPSRQSQYDSVLKRATLEEMWTPRLAADVDANGNPGFSTNIGLIFFIDERNGRRVVGHGGDQNGFLSYIDLDPVKRSASILVVNTDKHHPAETPPEKNVIVRLRRALRELL